MTGRAQLASGSPEETRAQGRALGALLEVGDFIGLVGPLGAGKTLFVRGLAEGAGVSPDEVSSPTFAIVQPYAGRLPLYHADFYRLGDARELHGTGFSDVGADGATVVEWLDRIPGAAPSDHLVVTLREGPSPDTRSIEIAAHGPRSLRLLQVWTGSTA